MKARLQSIQLGEAQTYKNITILPLITLVDGTFQYHTLGEALAAWEIAITETSDNGTVPELKVVNRSHNSILLVDGEEVAGAKQNRVLNTSILIKGVSATVIPVSCTEQGRWSYASQAFSESGNLMARKSRARKTRSVQASLESHGKHDSDQEEVWDGIHELQAKACFTSPTSAMSDVYKSREDDLRQCDAIFQPVPNQIGLLAIIDGRPVGMDMLSLTAAASHLQISARCAGSSSPRSPSLASHSRRSLRGRSDSSSVSRPARRRAAQSASFWLALNSSCSGL